MFFCAGVRELLSIQAYSSFAQIVMLCVIWLLGSLKNFLLILLDFLFICLQEQKLNKLVIESSNAKDFERAFKLNPKSEEPLDQNPFVNQSGDLRPPRPDQAPNGYDSNSSSEEMQKP